MRKLVAHLGWSDQCGRNLYLGRDPEEHKRYEGETQRVRATYARTGQPVVP
jgi:hypothetical protein